MRRAGSLGSSAFPRPLLDWVAKPEQATLQGGDRSTRLQVAPKSGGGGADDSIDKISMLDDLRVRQSCKNGRSRDHDSIE